MRINLRARSSTVLFSLFTFTVGCGTDHHDDDLAEEMSPIINGTSRTADGSGMVMLTTDVNLCSGTLITNDWVMTAAHCEAAAGDTITMGSQTRTALRVVNHPEAFFGGDVAMIQMSNPMIMNGSSSGFRRRIQSTLLAPGTVVECFGYGRNTLNGGSGSLRSAFLTINSSGNNQYSFLANGAGVTSHYFVGWANAVVGNWTFEAHTAINGAPLAASELSSYTHGGLRHVVYRESGTNDVIELYLGNGTYGAGNLTTVTNDVSAASAPFGYEENAIQHIVFRSGDGHIRELWWQAPSGWHKGDLTSITDAANAVGDPVAYLHGGRQNIVYRGSSNHIHALVHTPGPGWSHQNITSAIGAPPAASDPAVFVHNGTDQKIIYRNVNNHLIELWNVGGGWNWNNLTTAAGAPLASGKPSAYSFGGTQHVIFRSTSNRIIELWGGASGWNTHDVFATTAVPLAFGDPRGYASAATGKQHIVYRSGSSSSAGIVMLTGSSVGNFQIEAITEATGAPSNPIPANTPSALRDAANNSSHHVYYRDLTGAIFEMRSPAN
jgi:hypothetical protein